MDDVVSLAGLYACMHVCVYIVHERRVVLAAGGHGID